MGKRRVQHRAVQYAALPWRLDGGRAEYLLVTSRRRRRWIFPKGSARPDEPAAAAALREAAEEAGIEGRPAPEPLGHYAASKLGEAGVRPLRVELWPVEITGLADSYPEEHLRERRLVGIEEARRLIAQPDMLALLERFHAGLRR